MTPESRGFVEKLWKAMEITGIPYMVTGSFATAVHGVPRATQDIDVIIDPGRDQLLAFLDHFPEAEYYTDVADALEALESRSQFNVIDQRTIWKADFIFRKDRPFSRTEFERRRKTNILGLPLYAATPEDLLIAKLEWGKAGESDRQIRDAAGIIAIQGDGLDRAYIEKWVKAMGLAREWEEAQKETG